MAVVGPAGTGAVGAGVMSLGSPGQEVKIPGCVGGNSSRGISTRVGEAGPPYIDEPGDSVEPLREISDML